MKEKIRISRRNKAARMQAEPHQVHEETQVADPESETELAPEELTRADIRALKTMALDFERTLDYYHLRNHPWRNIGLSLVNGMARGLGFAIGLTVLAFILVSLIQSLNLLNIPIIGDFLADLLEYIDGVRNL